MGVARRIVATVLLIAAWLAGVSRAALLHPSDDAVCLSPVPALETPASGQCSADQPVAVPPWLPELAPPVSPWLARCPAAEFALPPGARIVSTGSDEGWRLEYRVGRGDTVARIAARFHVGAAAVMAANGLASPRHLVAGRWLHIPSALDAVDPERARRLPAAIRARAHRLLLVDHFERWAAEYRLPVELLEAVAWVESGWQSNALSARNAMGIAQLTPDTVDFVAQVLLRRPGNPWVPGENIRMGASFLRYLLDETNDLEDALAAYYQGLGALRTQGRYPGTDRYVDAVLAARALFAPTGDDGDREQPASAASDEAPRRAAPAPRG